MGTTAKSELRPYVEAWLDELKTCYEMEEAPNPAMGRFTEQPFFVRLPPKGHTLKLHSLIQADFSRLHNPSEIDEYIETHGTRGQNVTLERSNFPAGYYWTIIKKWDRWKTLRVIKRIDKYVEDLVGFWEIHWQRHGGERSPYTREWIRWDNLVDAHRTVYHGEPEERHRVIGDKQFPAVVVMQRIERGEAARPDDIRVLEKWASPWCEQHVKPTHNALVKRLSKLPLNEDVKQQLRTDVDALYAAALAQDIEARHQCALAVVREWNTSWGGIVSAFFKTLGNAEYIRRLRAIMPLRRVGDPTWQQKARMKAKRDASKSKPNPAQ